MGRRNRHDVFVIGEEALAETATLPARGGAEPADAQEPESLELPSLERDLPRGPGARSSRWLAAIGIAAVPAAALALLELSSTGRPSRPQRPEASAPATPVLRPAPRAAVSPAPAEPPSSRLRDHRPDGARRAETQNRHAAAEREPIPTEAPVSPPPVPPSDPAPAPLPPSPPPPAGGGGSGGAERFGFER